ncbi:MAG: type II secretion system F family protein [Phycisphaeraceae bacterium]
MQILIIILFGVAAGLGAWVGQRAIVGWVHRERTWMIETARRFTPEAIDVNRWFWGLTAARILLLLLLLYIIPNPILAIAFWLATFLLSPIVIDFVWNRRRRAIRDQLPAAVGAMANSVRAGLSLPQALQRLAENTPQPIRNEFRIMANGYALGLDMQTILNDARRKLDLQEFNLVVSALLVNREMGGDIATTLSRIAVSLEKLKQMMGAIRAETAEGRTNIKVLLAAPIFMLLMMATVDGEGVALLFQTIEGIAILTLAGLLAGAGIFWASRIVGQEV